MCTCLKIQNKCSLDETFPKGWKTDSLIVSIITLICSWWDWAWLDFKPILPVRYPNLIGHRLRENLSNIKTDINATKCKFNNP